MMSEIAEEPSTSGPLDLLYYVTNTQKALRDLKLQIIAQRYDERHEKSYCTQIKKWHDTSVGWSNYWFVNELGSIQLYKELWTEQGYQFLTEVWKHLLQDCILILCQEPKPTLPGAKWKLFNAIRPRRRSHNDIDMAAGDGLLARCFSSIQTKLQAVVDFADGLFKVSHPGWNEDSPEDLRAKKRISFELVSQHHYRALHRYCLESPASTTLFLELDSIIEDDSPISPVTSSETGSPTLQSIIWTMDKPLSTYQKKVDFLIPDDKGICGFLTKDSDLVVDYSEPLLHVIMNSQRRILDESFWFAGVRLELALVMARAGIPLLNTPWFSGICSCRLRRTMLKSGRVGVALAASPSHQTQANGPSSTPTHWCDYVTQGDEPLRQLGMVLAEIGIGAPIYFGAPLQQGSSLSGDPQDDMIAQRIHHQISKGYFPEPATAGGLPKTESEIDLILERVQESTNSMYFREAVGYCLHGHLRLKDEGQRELEEYYRRVIVPLQKCHSTFVRVVNHPKMPGSSDRQKKDKDIGGSEDLWFQTNV